jgi:hypothetical protein
VHINAGAAAAAMVAGRRIGRPKESFKPHNVPMVALGAGLLWLGWFGFNAGSGLAADAIAGLAFVNTQVATAGAVLGWLVVAEAARSDTDTILGDVTEFRTSIARIADSAERDPAGDRQASVGGRADARPAADGGAVDRGRRGQRRVGGARRGQRRGGRQRRPERLRSISTASGHPTRRHQVRGAREWFLTPDVAHLVECGPDGGSAAY